MVTLVLCFWVSSEVEQQAGNTWWRKTAHFMVARKQREKGRCQDKIQSPKGMSQRTHFLQKGHILKFPSLANSPSHYGPMDGQIHWWGQSPYNDITSWKPHLWT
jgi:hypothetical protein